MTARASFNPTFVNRMLRRALALAVMFAVPAAAQDAGIERLQLSVGRSMPITTATAITKVSVATPEVADVVVVGERELVINAKTAGETDAIIWLQSGRRQHYRVSVHSPSDRLQLALYVKFAEVRRDVLDQMGVSFRYVGKNARTGTDRLRTDDGVTANPTTGQQTLSIPSDARFLTVLTDFGTDNLLALIEAEEQRGNARVLAEPNLMAGNKDTATFLAGGELPIPIVQGSGDGNRFVTIQYREFGVRLRFVGEILSDSLVKLTVTPEVSTLDYTNAVVLSGVRVPALRTRRVESTIDVRRDESIVISGMFNSEEEKVKTGIPILMHLPILGALFSSTRFQRNESELLVIVRPVVIDPMALRAIDTVPTLPDTALPARDQLERRKKAPEAKRSWWQRMFGRSATQEK